MFNIDEYYMNEAIKEAKKAYKKNEIPVGVIIVKDDKIISRGHNLRDSINVVTKHAEIIAIEKANKKLNNWRLNNAILYSTLEPCNMCKEVIKEAKIKKVIFAAKNNNLNTNLNSSYYQISSSKLIKLSESLIKEKFKEIRNIH